jgi:hypothetical protein
MVSIVNYVAAFAALISLNIQRVARSLFCADKAHLEGTNTFVWKFSEAENTRFLTLAH